MKKLLIGLIAISISFSAMASNCRVSYQSADLGGFDDFPEIGTFMKTMKSGLIKKGYTFEDFASNSDFTLRIKADYTGNNVEPLIVRRISVYTKMISNINNEEIAYSSTSKRFLFANNAIGPKLFKVANKAMKKFLKKLPSCNL